MPNFPCRNTSCGRIHPDFPCRNKSCGRIHLTDNALLGWPDPSDPPTGTPKNGRRTKRVGTAGTKRKHQLATPPNSQEPEGAIIAAQDDSLLHGFRAVTPTPGESPRAVGNTPDSQSARKTLYVAEGTFNLEVLVDASVDDKAPSSPSSSASSIPSKRASKAKVNMVRQSPRHDHTVFSPSGSTILVPETDLDDMPESSKRQRHKISSYTNTSEQEKSTQRFRIQRRLFTKTLEESNQHVRHLRRTNEFQAQELSREKQARKLAEAEVVCAGARAKAERQAELTMMREENRTLRTTLVALLMALVAYALWCQANTVSFAYIRKADMKRYGL